MTVTLDEQLLQELKDNLQITWNDENTDNTLSRYIKSSTTYFNELCETEFSFDEGSMERELMLERCRYAWNNALDEFEINYAKRLRSLILSVAVEQHVAAIGTGDSTG